MVIIVPDDNIIGAKETLAYYFGDIHVVEVTELSTFEQTKLGGANHA